MDNETSLSSIDVQALMNQDAPELIKECSRFEIQFYKIL